MSRKRWWVYAIALWAWVLGAPFAVLVAALVAMHTRVLGSLIPCPLCSSHEFLCAHRAWAQAGLHVAGVIGILWAWSRRAPDTPETPALRLGPRWPLAAFQTTFTWLALWLERGDVKSIVWTGPLLAATACVLVAPMGDAVTRLVGAFGLTTALAGFYAIALFQLAPGEAEGPIFNLGGVGALATTITLLVGVLGFFTRRGAPAAARDRSSRPPPS